MIAVLPCYPSPWPDDNDNPRVVLDVIRVIGDTWDGEGWQAFTVLWGQYACRTGDTWKVVPFDTVEVFGKHFVEAQHKAYNAIA